MRWSADDRRRTFCVALAAVAHLALLRVAVVQPKIEWPADPTAVPLAVHIAPQVDRPPTIETIVPTTTPAPRTSSPRERHGAKRSDAIDSAPPRTDAPMPRAEPAPTDTTSPIALPDGPSTRRLLADLDRQQDTVARTRERLAFPVRDGFGANPLGNAVEDSAREDCADTLRHPSILGLLSMARDTVRNKGCRW